MTYGLSPSEGSASLFCSFWDFSSAVSEISEGTVPSCASRRTGNGRVKAQLVRLKVPEDRREIVDETADHLKDLRGFLCDSRCAAIWAAMRLCSERTAHSRFQRLELQRVAKDW